MVKPKYGIACNPMVDFETEMTKRDKYFNQLSHLLTFL